MKWYSVKKYRPMNGIYLVLMENGTIYHAKSVAYKHGQEFNCWETIEGELSIDEGISHFAMIEPVEIEE
jgi:hypothetical protein